MAHMALPDKVPFVSDLALVTKSIFKFQGRTEMLRPSCILYILSVYILPSSPQGLKTAEIVILSSISPSGDLNLGLPDLSLTP